MAELRSIDMLGEETEIRLSISNDEHKILKHHTKDIIVLPCGDDVLARELTTGKLGNSNRVMLPKKMLQSFDINELDKKVASNIFIIDGNAYLLIKIKKSDFGVPKFEEE